MKAVKEYLYDRIKEERRPNSGVMSNVLTLSLAILLFLSLSLALIVGEKGYSKNTLGFMVLLLL